MNSLECSSRENSLIDALPTEVWAHIFSYVEPYRYSLRLLCKSFQQGYDQTLSMRKVSNFFEYNGKLTHFFHNCMNETGQLPLPCNPGEDELFRKSCSLTSEPWIQENPNKHIAGDVSRRGSLPICAYKYSRGYKPIPDVREVVFFDDSVYIEKLNCEFSIKYPFQFQYHDGLIGFCYGQHLTVVDPKERRIGYFLLSEGFVFVGERLFHVLPCERLIRAVYVSRMDNCLVVESDPVRGYVDLLNPLTNFEKFEDIERMPSEPRVYTSQRIGTIVSKVVSGSPSSLVLTHLPSKISKRIPIGSSFPHLFEESVVLEKSNKGTASFYSYSLT